MELTTKQAAAVSDASAMTLRNYIDRGLLPARRVGLKRLIRINVDDLRKFASEYGFLVDETAIDNIKSQK